MTDDDEEPVSRGVALYRKKAGYKPRTRRDHVPADTRTFREKRLPERVKVGRWWIHPDAVHERASSYTNYGCQCKLCRTATREYYRKDRERKKAA